MDKHNYFVLLKDRNPETVKESTNKNSEALMKLIEEQNLLSEVGNSEVTLGLLIFQCTDKVAELFRAQAEIVEDVTRLDTNEEMQEYLLTKVLTPEQIENIRREEEKVASHCAYYVLIKDRDGDIDAKTLKTKDALKALLVEKNLWNSSEISGFEFFFPYGLIAIMCTSEVAEFTRAQTTLIEDVTKIETEEQGQEYMFTRVMKPEDVKEFLEDQGDITF